MEEIEFHHSLPIQLRFNDVDKFGHVNNTVYFSFYDLGKTEYFASVCPGVDWEKDGIVVVHIEADFLAQIFSSDHIAVQTAVCEIGTKSFHLILESEGGGYAASEFGSEMHLSFGHGDIRSGETRIQATDRRMDRGNLSVRRERLKKEKINNPP